MTYLSNDNFIDSSNTNHSLFNNILYFPFMFNNVDNVDISQLNFLPDNFENNTINERTIDLPEHYTFEKIAKEIFPKFNQNEAKKYFQNNDSIINLEKKMSDEAYKQPKTRNRGIKLPKELKKKSGRKRKEDTSFSKHNKYSPDNIIKKIKTKILDYLLIFINESLNSVLDNNTIKSYLKIINKGEYEENNKANLIKYIDYELFINKMKKASNIDFLKMTLKEFLSKDISPKFTKIKKNANSIIIEDLSKQNNEILDFIFNLKLGDWLDVFLYKKEFEIMNRNQIEIIMNSFQRVDKLLISICKEFDIKYMSIFIYCLYNFERWFLIKIGRNKKELTNNNHIIFNISENKCKNEKIIFTTHKYFNK